MPEIDDIDQLDPTNPDSLKDLRRAAKDGRSARTEADAARKELIFVKAGIDTESKLGKLLLSSYTGDLTAEAIKAEAVDLGLIKVDDAPPPPPPTPAETDDGSTNARNALSTGATGNEPPPPADPYKLAAETYQMAVANGSKREESLAFAMSRIREAANAGDQRVLWSPTTAPPAEF